MLKKKPVVRKTTTVKKYKEGGKAYQKMTPAERNANTLAGLKDDFSGETDRKLKEKKEADRLAKFTKGTVKGGAFTDLKKSVLDKSKGSGDTRVDKARMKIADIDMDINRYKRELNRLGKSKDASVAPAYSSNERMLKQSRERKQKALAELNGIKATKSQSEMEKQNSGNNKTKTPVKKKTDVKQKEAMGNTVGTLPIQSTGTLYTGVKTGEIQNLNLPAKATPTKSTATGKAKVKEVRGEIKSARKANRQEARTDRKVNRLEKKLERVKGTTMKNGGVKKYKTGGTVGQPKPKMIPANETPT